MLLSDRGAPFLSALANEVYRILRVKKLFTAAYRPQTNGLVERFNATIATMLSMFTDSQHRDWDRFLPYLVFAYNTSVHVGTKESPFFLLYGREARLPLDVMLLPEDPHENRSVEQYTAELVEGLRLAHEDGREALKKGQQQRELRTGKGRNVIEYKAGDTVMVKNPGLAALPGMTKKLLHTWTGPFKILKKMSQTTYEVTSVSGQGRSVSTNRLKRYYDREHVEADEDDYADHLRSAGSPEPGEGNRTTEPNEELDQQGESKDTDAMDEDNEEFGSASVRKRQRSRSSSRERPAQESATASTESTSSSRRKSRRLAVQQDTAPAATGTFSGAGAGRTEVPPDGGMIVLCKVCKLPKRGHVCSGRYIPVRQSAINRRRMGIAAAGAPPLFGLLTTKDDKTSLSGVYGSNDFRPVFGARIPSWEGLCASKGRTGDDIWDEHCTNCQGTGKVYSCFSCNRVYHPRCLTRSVLNRRLNADEELMCKECFKDSLASATGIMD